MNLTYILLAITVVTALFIRSKSILFLSVLLTNIVAFYQGIAEISALLYLAAFSLICHLYFNNKNIRGLTRSVLFAFIVIFTASFVFHYIPGFHNTLAINSLRLTPFSMYISYDKIMAALIIYLTSNLYSIERYLEIKSLKQTLKILCACIIVIISPAYFSGYIQFDAKVPAVLWLWALNNLLFVCMAEEVIYRGFLQRTLSSWLKSRIGSSYMPIIIASVIFGLSHFTNGVIFTVLASICGIFYGYTYHKTNRVFCAMLVHFGLNLFHLLFFTYPAAISMCKWL